jgi:hypothetical protein
MDRPINRLIYKINPNQTTIDNDPVDALSDGYGRQRVIIDGGSFNVAPGPTGQQTMALSQPVVIASNQSPIAITGSITASNPSVSNTGSTIPVSATMIGGSDGTNLRSLKVSAVGVLSIDGSASTQPVSGSVSISNFPGTQPISGTITSNIGTTNGLALDSTLSSLSNKFNSLGQKNSASSVPVVIASDQSSIPVSDSALFAKFGALGQAAMAGSAPVVIASNQSALPVTGTFFQATQPVSGAVTVSNFPATQPISGSVTANIGTTNGLALDASVAKLNIAQGAALGSNTQVLIGGSVSTSAPAYTAGQISPLSIDPTGNLRTTSTATVAGQVQVVGTAASGAAASGNPIPVAGKDGSGNIRPILTSTTGLTRTTYDYGSPPVSMWNSMLFSSFAAAGVAIKASPGVLRYFQFINNSGSAGNIHLFDRTTQPANGAIPMFVLAIAAGAAATLGLFEGGMPFNNGIYIAMSSTLVTYTAVASTAFTGVTIYA